MKKNRKLVLSGVSLTTIRPNRLDLPIMSEIMDDLEPQIIKSRYLDEAPFEWIGLILRYGLKDDEVPSYQRINKKYGDLPVAIEVDARELRRATSDELRHKFMLATLNTLIHIGKKYKLPIKEFEEQFRLLNSNGC